MDHAGDQVTRTDTLAAAVAAHSDAVAAERTARAARDLEIMRAWKAGATMPELVATTGLKRAWLYRLLNMAGQAG